MGGFLAKTPVFCWYSALRPLLALFLLAISALGRADGSIRLWNQDGDLVPNYDVLVSQLRSGTELELAPGKIVRLGRFLGKGNTTLVFSISDGKALRLPLRSGLTPWGGVEYRAFIDWYLEGYQKLKDTEIPLVKVFEDESSPPDYLVVEQEKIRFTLKDALDRGLTDDELGRLKDFARKTWKISYVGDMRPDQIGLTDHGWVLIDYNHVVLRASSVSNPSLFSRMRKLPKGLEKQLTQEVRQVRRLREGELVPGKFKCLFDTLKGIF